MPVHRHWHGERASVYALTHEIDAWRSRRETSLYTMPPAPASPPTPTPIVGRRDELARLRCTFDRMREGNRQLVIVTGEMGIGKTALLETFLAELPHSAWAATGQCVEHEDEPDPCLPFLDALAALATGEQGRLDRWIDRQAPSWSALILRGRSRRQPACACARHQRRPSTELCHLIEALARIKPFVIVIEDLHHSDRPTLDLLHRLVRGSESVPLLIVVSIRPWGIYERPAIWRLCEEDRGRCQRVMLPIPPLDEDATWKYLTRIGPWGNPVEATQWAHEQSEGNPLFLSHVARQMVDSASMCAASVPHGLRALVAMQLASLNHAVVQLLEAAALIGREFSATSIAAATGVTVVEVERHLERLARGSEIIVRRAPGYAFVRRCVWRVIEEGIPAATRVVLQSRIGSAP